MAALQRLWVIVNPRSGGASAEAPERIAALCNELGVVVLGQTVLDEAVSIDFEAIRQSTAQAVVSLAGDGTLRAVLEALDRPTDPPVIPLPGGTMNMLPYKVFDPAPWEDLLPAVIARPQLTTVPAGKIGDHRFYVAAMLGMPALWQIPREALRARQMYRALQALRLAASRMFEGGLTVAWKDGDAVGIEAAVLMPQDLGLEIATLSTRNWRQALGLMLTHADSDWRDHEDVETGLAQTARISRGPRPIPALLDGEFFLLPPDATARHLPTGARFLRAAHAPVASV